MTRNRLIAAVMAAALTGHVSAGALDQSINDMFSNITRPGSTSDNMRGALYGGSAYIRTPNMVISPIQIDMPRFSAGCGGIDATLGSFAWISSDKIMQFARKVIQQAVPVAFDSALSTYSPQLHQIWSKFQTLAQAVNSFNMNSCQLAKSIGDPIGKSLGEMANAANNAAGKLYGANSGEIEDYSAGADKVLEKPSGFFMSMFNNAPRNNKGYKVFDAKSAGNVTWSALNYKENELGFNFYIDQDPIVSKQVIMGLIGTIVNAPKNKDDPSSEMDVKPFDPLITFKNLVVDREKLETQTLEVYVCDDADCLKPTPSKIAFKGIKAYVTKMMLGSETAKTAETGSIVDVMSSNANCATSGGTGMNCFTTAQRDFLSAYSQTPVLALLRRSQFNKNLLDNTAKQLINILTAEVAATFGARVQKVIKMVYVGNVYPKPPNMDANIMTQMETDIAAYESESAKSQEKLIAATQQIDAMVKSNPQLLGWKYRQSQVK